MILQTFTVTSEHTVFTFLVFLFYTFYSCCFRAVDKADSCRLSAHVKIASRVVSYRKAIYTYTVLRSELNCTQLQLEDC